MEPYRKRDLRRSKNRTGSGPVLVAPKEAVDRIPATVTPIVKLDMGLNIEMTVAMPCYRANKIAWLALESLCRQKDIDFEWELIICEEEHEQMIGDWTINEYITRLIDAGCRKIVYLHLDRWVLLAKKWQIIGQHMSDTSEAFMLHAADCYSGAQRLKMSYDQVVKNGIGWYDFKRGYFYSFISNRVILYDFDGQTNLCMCFQSKYAHRIPNTDMKNGIDYFLLKHCLSKNRGLRILHDKTLIEDSVDTHGLNNISVHREEFFDSKPQIFHPTDTKLSSIITDEGIYQKLMTLENHYPQA